MLTHSLWAALHGAICLVVAGKLSEPELGDLASRLALMVLGISQHFTVPPRQASPSHDVHAASASGTLHMAAATHVAAE
jgi:hypothetical protein